MSQKKSIILSSAFSSVPTSLHRTYPTPNPQEIKVTKLKCTDIDAFYVVGP